MDDVFEEEAEQTVTIHEYLKDVEDQELEADLVLGGDEGKECTYNKGYMKRQAIFSCLTCTPDGNAGVCTACSLSCHDGHEVFELWTKRNFKCDCGNSKFGALFCKLFANKDPENLGNAYNHNFKGSYCECGRPYPDPDAEEQVEMIQCCICEDWCHENHLGLQSPAEIPRDDEGEPLYEDFICQACGVICSFLTLYPQTIWAPLRQNDAQPGSSKESNMLGDAQSACPSSLKLDNDISSPKLLKNVSSLTNSDIEKTSSEKDASARQMSEKTMGLEGNTSVDAPSFCSTGKLENGSCSSYSVRKDCFPPHDEFENKASKEGEFLAEIPVKTMDLKQCSQNPDVNSKCIVGVDLRVAPFVLEKEKPMFLSKNWRDLLCRCDTCTEFYACKGIRFLIDREDSIIEYEKMAKQKREEKLQQQEGVELNFLNGLGHVEKMEIMNGIADMQNGLRSFLESSDPSKPITTDDVHQFFENLSKKRRRIL
ncbi:putative E3 ubiquitin-protein ligase UBR7 [Macadamia integrifolia]|uniref:putative E3 ubiquitin-protein ligase UBR7 n=1 Tax=Macadamia integrifolia TaxID=60698 RepID=UPI001C4E3711|nr:putative E3 ubiquitin-protein ligase UBR7 [Macadamia integrifolia]